ncbi:MAG: hypothetical protein CMF39_05385 [Legionellaceae bacterium]|nr:hypothetical protein [Legionellaceae bacterium]
MREQYDSIAGKYNLDEVNDILRKYVYFPTLKAYSSGLNMESVLDAGCGTGVYARKLKKMGAGTVIGIDVSEEMIALARSKEASSPLGIHYEVRNLETTSDLPRSTFVLAGFCLHYASNVEALNHMCKKLADALSEDGVLIAFNENPNIPLHEGIIYGVSTTMDGLPKDGSTITRTHYDRLSTRNYSFSHQHYSFDTYQSALLNAGFNKVELKPFVVLPEADNLFPEENWDLLRNNQYSIAVLVARKSV